MARELYGLMGDPVSHSLSPQIHTEAFSLLARDAAYVPFRVPAERLAAAFEAARTLGIAGFNVTVPHKEAAARLCDALEGDAERLGAVNVVVNKDGRFIGHNTDTLGVLKALEKARCAAHGRRALVLGAGGAGRGAAYALAKAGAGELIIANRTFARARALAEDLAAQGVDALAAPLSAACVRELLPMCHIVINATSVGLNAPDDSPIPAEAEFEPGTVALDLVYRPLKTRFWTMAREQGAVVVDGLEVLVHQGIGALSLWLGRPLDASRLAPPLRAAALEAML